jgi:hypothetical protein
MASRLVVRASVTTSRTIRQLAIVQRGKRVASKEFEASRDSLGASIRSRRDRDGVDAEGIELMDRLVEGVAEEWGLKIV